MEIYVVVSSYDSYDGYSEYHDGDIIGLFDSEEKAKEAIIYLEKKSKEKGAYHNFVSDFFDYEYYKANIFNSIEKWKKDNEEIIEDNT